MCPQTHIHLSVDKKPFHLERLDQPVNIPALRNMCPIPSPAGQLIAESTSRTKQPFNSRKGELRNCHVAGQQYYYIWSEATDELRT